MFIFLDAVFLICRIGIEVFDEDIAKEFLMEEEESWLKVPNENCRMRRLMTVAGYYSRERDFKAMIVNTISYWVLCYRYRDSDANNQSRRHTVQYSGLIALKMFPRVNPNAPLLMHWARRELPFSGNRSGCRSRILCTLKFALVVSLGNTVPSRSIERLDQADIKDWRNMNPMLGGLTMIWYDVLSGGLPIT